MTRKILALCCSALLTLAVSAADPADLAGQWSGAYYYPPAANGQTQAPVNFTVQLQVAGTRVSGRSAEPNTFGDRSAQYLYANLEGMVTAGGRLNLNKQYDGSGGVGHAVAYSGTIDASGTRISGNWVTADGYSGRFEMAQTQRAAQQGCLTPGQPRTEGTFYIIPFGNRCDHDVMVTVCAVHATIRNIVGANIPAHGGADVTLGNVPPLLSTPWSETDRNLCDHL